MYENRNIFKKDIIKIKVGHVICEATKAKFLPILAHDFPTIKSSFKPQF